jgi:hypothetical protein
MRCQPETVVAILSARTPPVGRNAENAKRPRALRPGPPESVMNEARG